MLNNLNMVKRSLFRWIENDDVVIEDSENWIFSGENRKSCPKYVFANESLQNCSQSVSSNIQISDNELRVNGNVFISKHSYTRDSCGNSVILSSL
jgi:hypothetical protein